MYLAFFFSSLEIYSALLLKDFHVKYLNFGFAVIIALVIAKVILLGEYARVGKRYEDRPLMLSAGYKALLFVLLVFAFHMVEEFVKHILHKETVAGAINQVRVDDRWAGYRGILHLPPALCLPRTSARNGRGEVCSSVFPLGKD